MSWSQLVNLKVKTFNDKNTLFTPRENVAITEIENPEKVIPLP